MGLRMDAAAATKSRLQEGATYSGCDSYVNFLIAAKQCYLFFPAPANGSQCRPRPI